MQLGLCNQELGVGGGYFYYIGICRSGTGFSLYLHFLLLSACEPSSTFIVHLFFFLCLFLFLFSPL